MSPFVAPHTRFCPAVWAAIVGFLFDLFAECSGASSVRTENRCFQSTFKSFLHVFLLDVFVEHVIDCVNLDLITASGRPALWIFTCVLESFVQTGYVQPMARNAIQVDTVKRIALFKTHSALWLRSQVLGWWLILVFLVRGASVSLQVCALSTADVCNNFCGVKCDLMMML